MDLFSIGKSSSLSQPGLQMVPTFQFLSPKPKLQD